MNQLFSFRRFGLLLRLHLSENIRTYLISLAVVGGVLAMLMATALRVKHFDSSIYTTHEMFFVLGLGLSSVWLASESFRAVHEAGRGIHYLTLPASMLEKYLVSLLMLLVYIPIYWLIFLTIESIYFSIVNTGLAESSQKFEIIKPLIQKDNRSDMPYFIIFLGQSLFFLGSITFRKTAFIKTGFVALALYAGGLYLNSLVLHWMIPDLYQVNNSFPFVGLSLTNSKGHFASLVPPIGVQQAVKYFWALVIPAIWFITYVRFREKEI